MLLSTDGATTSARRRADRRPAGACVRTEQARRTALCNIVIGDSIVEAGQVPWYRYGRVHSLMKAVGTTTKFSILINTVDTADVLVLIFYSCSIRAVPGTCIKFLKYTVALTNSAR